MPQKSWLDLQWPVAGIDRAIPYQKQPPYTTPDAVNVRSEGVKEFRERGGSRPGLGLTFRTQLPGPIRMLTKVSVLKQGWPRAISPISGTQLRDTVLAVPGFSSGNYSYGPVGSQTGSWLAGDFSQGVPVVPGDSSNSPYELTLHVRSRNAFDLNGSVSINFDLPTETSDPTVDGRVIELTFSGGTYSAQYRRYISSVLSEQIDSLVYSDNPNAGGKFTVRISPLLGNIKAWWRNQLLLDIGAGEVEGWIWQDLDEHQEQGGDLMIWQGGLIGGGTLDTTGKWGFGSASVDSSVEVTAINHDFGKDESVHVAPDARRDLIVAVSEGQLWVEDTVETMVRVPNVDLLRSDVELSAVDREQKLYIADYGAVLDGQAGSVASATGYRVLETGGDTTSVDNTFAVQVVDSSYFHNQQQEITITADGGTYTLSFLGQETGNLNWNADASTVQSALEGLSTIGAGNVSVFGTGPLTVEFIGVFKAQDQTLLTSDITNLTLTTGTASLTIAESRGAAGPEYLNGTYELVSASGTTIDFHPALPVAAGYSLDVSAVDYRIVRTPKVFNPKDNTLQPHKASKGVAPAGCRLIALYRDRIVYAHTDTEPNVWYMSRQGDPDDWDTTQEDSGAAIFAQSAVAGKLADPITALITHGDECLIVGSYSSLWIVRGDPGFGGTMDQLSRKIGIVGPHAWCRTPDDMCVFMSHDGLFVMPAGCAGFPTSLSRERLPDELLCLSADREVVTLEYDSLFRGINVMVTRLDGSEGEHWWFDWEAKSFWRVRIQQGHDPFAQHERNSWDICPITLQGGRDGYIRNFDRDEEVDDGDYEIDSYCYLGPFHLDRRGYTEGVLSELQATTGTGTGPIVWSAHVGDGNQQAFEAGAQETGEWNNNGLNYNAHPRARGVSACVRVGNKTGAKRRWFLERVTAVVRSAGRRRVKG